MWRRVALLVFVPALAAVPLDALAQTSPPTAAPGIVPEPLATPTPPPIGYTVHGHLVVTGQPGGPPMRLRVALERRGREVRLDFAGEPGATGAAPVPGTAVHSAVLVVDPLTHRAVVWSAESKRYHAQRTPSTPNTPGALHGSPLAMFETFGFSFHLTGRSSVHGIPTDDISFDFDAQLRGLGLAVHVGGKLQLAQNSYLVPLGAELDLGHPAGTTKPMQIPNGPLIPALPIPAMTARAVFVADDVSYEVPPESDFAPPDGYQSVTSLLPVMMPSLPAVPAPPFPYAAPVPPMPTFPAPPPTPRPPAR